MSEENIKKKFEIAKNIVQEEKEPFRTEGFKIIFSFLLDSDINSQKKILGKKLTPPSRKSKNNSEDIELKTDFEEIVSKSNITAGEFKETISIHENIIEILKRRKEKENKKHVIFSIVILTIYRVLSEREWMKASLLKKSLDKSGVGDLNHLPRSLKKTSLIVGTGSSSSKKYMVTGKGMDLGFEYIRKLSKDQEMEESNNN